MAIESVQQDTSTVRWDAINALEKLTAQAKAVADFMMCKTRPSDLDERTVSNAGWLMHDMLEKIDELAQTLYITPRDPQQEQSKGGVA